MDCFMIKKGYDMDKLIKDYRIAENNHKFINPSYK